MRARRWSCRHWTTPAAQLLAFCRESWLALKGQGLSGRPPAGHLQLGVAGRGHGAALARLWLDWLQPLSGGPAGLPHHSISQPWNTDPHQSRLTPLNVDESQLHPSFFTMALASSASTMPTSGGSQQKTDPPAVQFTNAQDLLDLFNCTYGDFSLLSHVLRTASPSCSCLVSQVPH